VNLYDVQEEISTALQRIDGLRRFAYGPQRITPPAAMVGWPANLEFDQTMGRGSDSVTLPLFICVGHIDARASRINLAKYLQGSGSHSVKAAIDAFTFSACDSAVCARARVEMVGVADVEYLSAVFEIEVYGEGTR
jgi:hypothetical protein